jgi:hypothetical protein
VAEAKRGMDWKRRLESSAEPVHKDLRLHQEYPLAAKYAVRGSLKTKPLGCAMSSSMQTVHRYAVATSSQSRRRLARPR